MMKTESERGGFDSSYDKAYDIGNKGYLTKFERQLKELDEDVEVIGVEEEDLEVASTSGQQNRFSTSGISFDNGIPQNRREWFDDDLDDLACSEHGKLNMSIDESERSNYHNYLAKVQRELQEVEFHQNMSMREEHSGIAASLMKNTSFSSSTSSCIAVFTPRAKSCLSKKYLLVGLIVLCLLASILELVSLRKKRTAPGGIQIDSSSGTLFSGKDKTVPLSTMGSGMLVELFMNAPLENERGDSANPFACLESGAVLDLWDWTKQGRTANVAVLEEVTFQDLKGNEKSRSTTEYGLQLSFHGADQNGTHACMPTLNERQTLCFDFQSDRCENDDDANTEKEGDCVPHFTDYLCRRFVSVFLVEGNY